MHFLLFDDFMFLQNSFNNLNILIVISIYSSRISEITTSNYNQKILICRKTFLSSFIISRTLFAP